MRNYTPIMNTINLTRNASPFATAGASIASNSIRTGSALSRLGGSKITLSGILNGAQKTIGTVNQIVPIYNQIKPMFQNSKVLFNVVKGFRQNATPHRRNWNNTIKSNNNTIEAEISKEIILPSNKEKNTGKEPAKPFFL